MLFKLAPIYQNKQFLNQFVVYIYQKQYMKKFINSIVKVLQNFIRFFYKANAQ